MFKYTLHIGLLYYIWCGIATIAPPNSGWTTSLGYASFWSTAYPYMPFIKTATFLLGTTTTNDQEQSMCTHVIYPVEDFLKCDKDNDRFVEFSINLDDLASRLIRKQTGLVVTYHNAGGDLIDFAIGTQFVVNQRTVRARATDVDGCYKETSFKLTLVSPPKAEILSNVVECEQYVLPPLENNSNYFTGINGSGTQFYEGNTIRTSRTLYVYAVGADCSDESNFTITIDPSLCQENEEEPIYEFPKFFTPNGDGSNDEWKFDSSDYSQDRKLRHIEIFDRFGLLLRKLGPDSDGWDGTYQGRPQPSSDYWYKALTFDQKVLQGHFTLKR